MRFQTRLFVILWLAGFVGILSFLLVDLNALLSGLPIPPGAQIPTITPALKLLSLIQPTVLLSLAVLIGVALAPKIGLSAPVAEAVANGRDWLAALKPQVAPGVTGGLVGGVVIVSLSWLLRLFLQPGLVARLDATGELLPLPTRLLFGGLTEELLLRWGLMTLLVWAIWRVFQKGANKPKPICFIAATVLSAVIFGIAHLPFVFGIVPNAPLALILYVIVANSIFGLFAGYLFWKIGLESAMIAHMLAHIVILSTSFLAARF